MIETELIFPFFRFPNLSGVYGFSPPTILAFIKLASRGSKIESLGFVHHDAQNLLSYSWRNNYWELLMSHLPNMTYFQYDQVSGYVAHIKFMLKALHQAPNLKTLRLNLHCNLYAELSGKLGSSYSSSSIKCVYVRAQNSAEIWPFWVNYPNVRRSIF